MFKSFQATSTDTATAIPLVENEPQEARKFGQDVGYSFVILNTGSNTTYLGGPDVSTSNGFPLAAGTSVPARAVSVNDVLYHRTATSQTTTLAGLGVGV